MRTTDFRRAPLMGQAGAQFVGGTKFTGVPAFIGLARRWFPLVRRMKRSAGYRGHKIWYTFPFTIGTIAFFETKDDLLAFARTPEHARIMRWVMRPGNAHGGFIRLFEALPSGYSSGVWRAEPGHELRAIEQFTPLTHEKEGPAVPPDPARGTNLDPSSPSGSRPSGPPAVVSTR
jgi:hypothetical protein